MAFDALTTTEIAVKKAITNPLMTKIKNNFDHLHGQTTSGSKVPNGSFEIDSDADGIPDLWDKDLYPGGTFSLQDADDDTSIHGAACVKFTHPSGASNGGGNITSDYIEVSNERMITVGWSIKVSATGAKNQVVIRYFDEDKVDLSADDTVYSSTSGPTSWTAMSSTSTPPANARYCKVKTIGGLDDTDPGAARDTYFDDIWFVEDALVWDKLESGNYVINQMSQATSNTNGYNKAHEFLVGVSGTVKTVVKLKHSAGGQINGRVYINGSPIGTARNTTVSTYQTWAEDIAVVKGDLIQLYLDNDNTGNLGYGILLVCISDSYIGTDNSIATSVLYTNMDTAAFVNLPILYNL